jgi:pimeloyl-ACP methyl ester carboxylesterase
LFVANPREEQSQLIRRTFMPTIFTKDGTQIYYKDWGKGQPIVFSHGWPLTADDWDGQMMFFGQRGYRVIAHDRRGHGRSTQTWDGNEMDTYADDLAALTEKLDLKNAIHVGHSTGGGEVARYIGRHGSKRVAMAVLISSVPPLMVKTEKNPLALPSRSSTACEPPTRRIGRSFTGTLLSRSTDTTGPAPRFPKASGRSGGSRE